MRVPDVTRTWFSLLELLVVLVVVMVLAGISFGSYRRLVTGNLVQSAARAVGSELLLARQQAVTRRRGVAVIMPGAMGGGEGGIPPGRLYTSFRRAYVDADAKFQSWVENSKWEFTPQTICIMEADGDLGIQDSGGYQVAPHEDDMVTVDGVDLRELDGGATVDNVRAVIFTSHSRLQANTTRYVTLGECSYSGGDWHIDRPETRPEAKNRSCINQWTIVVNRFTGSVSHLSPDQY